MGAVPPKPLHMSTSTAALLVACLTSVVACTTDTAGADATDAVTPANQYALVTTSMKLRATPDTAAAAAVLQVLAEGDVVEYTGERSPARMRLAWSDGAREEYWYRVDAGGGADDVGWVYGAGLLFGVDSLRDARLAAVTSALGAGHPDMGTFEACGFREVLEAGGASDYPAIGDWGRLGLERPRMLSIFDGNDSADDLPLRYLRTVDYDLPGVFGLAIYVDGYQGGFRLINYDARGRIVETHTLAYCEGDAGDSWERSAELRNGNTEIYTEDSNTSYGDGTGGEEGVTTEDAYVVRVGRGGRFERSAQQE